MGFLSLSLKLVVLAMLTNIAFFQWIKTGKYSCKKDSRVKEKILDVKCIHVSIDEDQSAHKMQIRCASVCLQHPPCEAFNVGYVANGSCILCELTEAEIEPVSEDRVTHCERMTEESRTSTLESITTTYSTTNTNQWKGETTEMTETTDGNEDCDNQNKGKGKSSKKGNGNCSEKSDKEKDKKGNNKGSGNKGNNKKNTF